MGTGHWDARMWDNYREKNISGRDAHSIYSARTMDPHFSPYRVTREARDSLEHPNSTPIIIGLDVTGSMARILEVIAQKIGIVMNQIYDRQPVPDPQVCFAAIGDSQFDDFPLQVTQFESDNRIVEQLTRIYFEQGGGGNYFESYPLIWYFAAHHTLCDQMQKREKKGFLFTFGDDGFPNTLTPQELRAIFGDSAWRAKPVESILEQAAEKYEIYHFCMQQGGTYRDSDFSRWKALLGQHAIRVQDYSKIPELVVSLLELHAGKDMDSIIQSWDSSASIVVADALHQVAFGGQSPKQGLITF